MNNLRGEMLFAVTGVNGAGLLCAADKPDAFRAKIAKMLGVSYRQLAALVEFCGLPTVRGGEKIEHHKPTCSVAATRAWLEEQDCHVRSGRFPVISSGKLCWLQRCGKGKPESKCTPLSVLIKKRKEAWAKICALGLEEETLLNLNFYRTKSVEPITAEKCASGAVLGDHMLQCAREALIDRERRAAMDEWHKMFPVAFFIETRWAESSIAANGLNYDIGDDKDEW